MPADASDTPTRSFGRPLVTATRRRHYGCRRRVPVAGLDAHLGRMVGGQYAQDRLENGPVALACFLASGHGLRIRCSSVGTKGHVIISHIRVWFLVACRFFRGGLDGIATCAARGAEWRHYVGSGYMDILRGPSGCPAVLSRPVPRPRVR